jgi:hypothetical protein
VIYARYSPDPQRATSIDDQIRLSKERIEAVLPVDRRPCKWSHPLRGWSQNGRCTECIRLLHPWPGKSAEKGRDIVIA